MDAARTGRRGLGRKLSRLLDLLALGVVAFVAYRLLIAPRLFEAPVQPSVPFALSGLAGPEYRLAPHPGHVVFLDFWASWCTPCRASLPLVERFARAHPDVEVVPIDSNEPAAAGAPFARSEGLRGAVSDAHGRVTAAYGVVAFPTIVVIDPRGFVRARWFGFNPAIELAMEHARTTFEPTNR